MNGTDKFLIERYVAGKWTPCIRARDRREVTRNIRGLAYFLDVPEKCFRVLKVVSVACAEAQAKEGQQR